MVRAREGIQVSWKNRGCVARIGAARVPCACRRVVPLPQQGRRNCNMVDQNLINELDSQSTGLSEELGALLEDSGSDLLVGELIDKRNDEFRSGSILTGHIVGRSGDDFVVDVGLKSEGLVACSEWDDPSSVDTGDTVQVWLESLESDTGHILLSKRKADRIINWHKIIESKHEGDTVTGRVMRKIKGGLLVDIGYPVFLPASQVDI